MFKIIMRQLLRISNKTIFWIMGLVGFLILIIPTPSTIESKFSFFLSFSLRTICCWIVGLMFLLLFLNPSNNKNEVNWFKTVQTTFLILLLTIFGAGPFLYLYLVLRNI